MLFCIFEVINRCDKIYLTIDLIKIMRLFKKLTTCPNKRLSSVLGSTLRTIPALRAGIVRADKREFIAHAARGGTRNESHCPAGRCLSARYAFPSRAAPCLVA